MNQRQLEQTELLRAEQAALRAAAAWVRDQAGATMAGLTEDRVASACGAVLDLLSEKLDTLPAQVRRHTVRIARELTGDPMDQPTTRRTRRRR